ncbi:putative HAT transposon superfamily protein [Quillaja saponaria]|uniref:HAT transposon superfamily protein n=1 Tax=Quillaja saponaria TaxID=32244 RepID=A0AAD7L5Y5_QUISA|nr:putative HAT transposon superfamily protein [Quillaja saponaria]
MSMIVDTIHQKTILSFCSDLKMTSCEGSINIHDHGTTIDQKKCRVKCNYCGKIVSGFFRLKCHLGGGSKDVKTCDGVPANIGELFRNKLLEAKKESIGRDAGELCYPDLPWKRNGCLNSNSVKHRKCESTQTAGHQNGRLEEMECVSNDSLTERVPIPSGHVCSQTDISDESKSCSTPSQLQKYIGQFFYETGLDFSAVNSPSFKRMIYAALSYGRVECKIPDCQELKGWILQDEVREMQEYVRKVRNTWETTGCSILLDGWKDEKGRSLVNFLVDCPEGMVYLRSSDVSPFIGDVDALNLLLDGVINEVGIGNVVQIIACSSTGWEGAIGKQFMERYRSVFWTVSASHCIELMLEKIVMIDSVKGVLEKAKTITKFIHGHPMLLQLLKKHTSGQALIKPSKIRSLVPILTLENIVREKEKLLDMLASSEWTTSSWVSMREGKRVAELVEDDSFWTGSEMVLKATIPLLRVLYLINGNNKGTVGYIYETMDQVKETIKKEFKNKKSQYMPFWEVIDEIWDSFLHSPLHAAGYYFNPSLFYSSDFFADAEVAFGLLCCIVRMVQELRVQDLISQQLDGYRLARGDFKDGSAVERINNTSPVRWWSQYGQQHPELQRFAIRILSQTCDGASKYGLKRTLAEKLLTKGRNQIEEQQQLRYLTFVHYNLQLQQYGSGGKSDLVGEEVDSMHNWILDDAPKIGSQSGNSSVFMDELGNH